MTVHDTQLQIQNKAHLERRSRLMNVKKVVKLPPADAMNEFEAEIKRQRQRNYELVHKLKEAVEERDQANTRAEAFSLDLADAQARIIAQAQMLSSIEGLDFEAPVKRPVKLIVAEVLDNYPGVTWQDIIGIRRERRLIQPRHECMHEVHRQRPDLSFPAIGRIFGGRDHTSVLWAVKKFKDPNMSVKK